jgi:hypothetical protein
MSPNKVVPSAGCFKVMRVSGMIRCESLILPAQRHQFSQLSLGIQKTKPTLFPSLKGVILQITEAKDEVYRNSNDVVIPVPETTFH